MRSGIRSDPRRWSDPRHRRGVAAEQQAKRYLKAQGWTILAHRYRVARHDIDLIARRGSLVAFIEVKSRAGSRFGSPMEAIRWAKRRELATAAWTWVDRHGEPGDVYRFDVIGVVRGRIEHLEDAFRPGWR